MNPEATYLYTIVLQVIECLENFPKFPKRKVTLSEDGDHVNVFIEVQGLENSITITGFGWALVSVSPKDPNTLFYSYNPNLGRYGKDPRNNLIDDPFDRFLAILLPLSEEALPELIEKMHQ